MKSISEIGFTLGGVVKIADVAKIAGVSNATVSRVLNGTGNVNSQTFAKVSQVIAELGYEPNRLARNLRLLGVKTLGVVVSDIENPHFAQATRAVEDQAYIYGYRVVLCNTDEEISKQKTYLKELGQERVSGIILSASDPDAPEITALLDMGIAVVAFDRQVRDPRADTVVANNISAGQIATRHLLEAGHQNIVCVRGPKTVPTSTQRAEGYLEEMTLAGFDPIFLNAGFGIDKTREVTLDFLSKFRSPIAFVVGNNLMTIGVLEAIKEKGLHIPNDVSIVGIDDPFWAKLVDPALTCVAQPAKQMAQSAVDLLFSKMKDPQRKPEKIVFEFSLKKRLSVGEIKNPSLKNTGRS